MSPDPELRDRASELADDLSGDLHFDDLHRRLYAQDASIFEHQPTGVAYPDSAEDLQQLVAFADRVGLGLIPRGGGTSLAGQCVGEGLVVDVGRHMNEILEVDVDEQWARVQPGVVLDDLNRHLADAGLMFGPDTSTADQCQIGGMIGNNSCGSHSVYFGTTRDHILELELVLSDGTTVRVGDEGSWERHRGADHRLGEALQVLERELDEHDDLIREEYPREEIIRRNSGYALDALVEADPKSLPPLICGSEGTLAFVTEAKVNLEERPGANLLVCAHFESLENALDATVAAVEHDPGAVELMDRRILELTREHPEQKKNRFFVEGEPGAILVIEMYG
ncbi:MAG: FAD-binding oxidoreductase, partial [Bradymonadaceae bacterium]